MLNRLDLETFKCFELMRLPLGPLTLLSGTNASGKSSILQSLVLLHQTMLENEWATRIILNGSITNLGTVTDVVDRVNGRDSFAIGLSNDDTSCNWAFTGDRRDMSLQVSKVTIQGEVMHDLETLRYLLPVDSGENAMSLAGRIRDLTYITAEREGPREFYPLEDQYKASRVGPQGENAVSVFYRSLDERVSDQITLQGVAPTVLHQVAARMDSFFPGCALDIQHVPNANAVTLGIRTSEATDFLRPIHCGFGITQVLPIIVAALSISKGSLLLIENPEVHLHPAGQAKMGQFLAEVAHSGIQVIVETHSDHVLNGIRRAVKSGRLPAEGAVLHFFRARSADEPQAMSPTLDSSGNVDVWPEGFFDQFDKDLDYFAGWGE